MLHKLLCGLVCARVTALHSASFSRGLRKRNQADEALSKLGLLQLISGIERERESSTVGTGIDACLIRRLRLDLIAQQSKHAKHGQHAEGEDSSVTRSVI